MTYCKKCKEEFKPTMWRIEYCLKCCVKAQEKLNKLSTDEYLKLTAKTIIK